ncbi:MAG: hypothetical protein BWZ10_02793 [candidate division BRC1 bacterium ADurb.BinA364]|nr:MAG: hypothetical protein BWZ10_02793 [candidate division BRC1 bacterium ADurb.BinA364]
MAAAALIRSLQWSVAIQPESIVEHDVEPERFSRKALRRTILAGLHVNYQLQKDFYIPFETSGPYMLSMASRKWHEWRKLRRENAAKAMEALYFSLGHISLAWRIYKDLLRRMRRSEANR